MTTIRDIDLLTEETSVETIARRLQQRYRQRAAGGGVTSAHEEVEEFSNIHLAPEIFFQLDYAARIFDPRDTPGNTRLIWLKKAIQRVMRVYTTRQVEFNATVVRILNRFFDVLHEVVEKFNYFRRAEVRLMRRIEHVEKFSQDLYQHRTRLEALEEAERQLSRRLSAVEDLRNKLEHALAENAALRQRLEDMLARGTGGGAKETSVVASAGVAPTREAWEVLNNDYLYLPYLNEDRAIEEVIRERVRYYLPFFTASEPAQPAGEIVDIGCGRGEFLDVCREEGIRCCGVDVNEDMVRHCRAKGHRVERGDAVGYLQGVRDGSLRGIMACHVIEHLPPAAVLTFLRLCVRKLAPGGRLVIETPNPSSVFGLSMFYRDFTHERPIHPSTLKFLLRELGMQEVEVEELHRAPERLQTAAGDEVSAENFEKLDRVVFGYLDYAVKAIR